MSLRVRSFKTRRLYKLLILPVFLFALVAQPMYGMVAERVASATAGVSGVVINESTPLTGSGAHDDKWIELYNPTDDVIDMSNWRFVLDDTTALSPTFPAGTVIAPKSFYVHSPTSLTTQSRKLELRTAPSNYQIIDTVTYPAMQNGQSYARTADGVGAFEIREAGSATKGASNTSSVVDEDEDPETPAAPEEPETPDTPEVPETPEQVTPIINGISPNKGYISGTQQRIDVYIANAEVVQGGVIQLNKVGNAHNNERANFPLQSDGDSWFAIIDTTDIKKGGNTRHEQGAHQGDGEYLYKVEVHHKFGHGPGKPWGYYGNGTSWNKPGYRFTVDNTAPATTVQKNADGRAFSGVIDAADTSDYVRVTFYQLGADGNTVKGENGAPIVLLTDTAEVLGGAWSYQISDENLARFALNGGYRVDVQTYDKLGNTGATGINYQFTYAPEVTDGKEENSGSEDGGGSGGGGGTTPSQREPDQPKNDFSQTITSNDLPSQLAQALSNLATPASITASNISFMTALAQATPTPQVQAITEAGNDEEMLGTATNLNQNGEVLGASTDGEERWSLLNAIAVGIAVLLGILALLGMRRTSEDENVHAGMRIMTAAIAAAGVVALFMTENFATEMGWMNGLTWVFGLGLVVQVILLIMAHRTASE